MSINYVTLMEFADVNDSVSNPQDTHITHVDIVDVIDKEGNPWEPVPGPDPWDDLVTVWGSQWISQEFYANTTAIAKTAVFSGGEDPVSYRYRLQKRIFGGDGTVSNGPWDSYDNTAIEVSEILPAPGYEVRFQSQASDVNGANNEFTGWKQVTPQPTIGTFYFMIEGDLAENDAYEAYQDQTFTVDAALSGGNATDITYQWSIRSGGAGIIGGSTNEQCTVDLGSTYTGTVQLQLNLSSNTASNSPVSKVLTIVVPPNNP